MKDLKEHLKDSFGRMRVILEDSYDNNILYEAMLGYGDEQLFELSNDIIKNRKNVRFDQTYDLSYDDIYDYESKKQSLNKWEMEKLKKLSK